MSRTHSVRMFTRALVLAVMLPAVAAAAAESSGMLVEAVRAGDVAAIRALLEQRADVNVPEPDGTTALHWAAHRAICLPSICSWTPVRTPRQPTCSASHRCRLPPRTATAKWSIVCWNVAPTRTPASRAVKRCS